ncbi:MAG TPA: sigma-54 dependent transcriptional regulator [Spirochaetia bacterium]|nr:sigma-54 dependent transcriptional regulator [Spirochaetales bacterium]HRS64991.1 sigma-54 dependent transcriptional regulator [Spirochaetia bacterium]HOT59224.1 sigma-54 dependent transcriptional regulator [Spirochaetales bacterium]HPD79670.1 sigma-54 dependent transcriptional regulator [Spirochaetales bacterium]HQG40016.1 sigma-54 dependent transcriptional regulator [Spirochaetales bacterium]
MKYTILIADDEKNIRNGIAEYLEAEGYETLTAEDGKEAISIINKGSVDLVITDLKMPNVNGMEVLNYVVSHFPTMPVIILTGHGTVEDAVQAMRIGAFDFISKPLNLEHLVMLIQRALERQELSRKNSELSQELARTKVSKLLIGKSASMHEVLNAVNRAAPTRANVLITGESGVGKEVIADSIHELSNRKDKPFIKVHCAALPEALLESELFGYEKGAFTGAVNRKRGRFELAHEGTLFLDEIGEINQNIQIKLLRVIQEKKFERIGGEQTIEVDVRIIAATNKDLKKEVEAGRFREDLYYRLNVVNIHVPPLRERKDDIPMLAQAFLEEFCKENKKQIHGFEPAARALLFSYSWPGNIRELRNVIESAVVMTTHTIITVEDLPPSIRNSSEQPFIRIPLGTSLEEAEKIIIRDTLMANKFNKSKTAELLGIGRKTLYQKINDYNLDDREASKAEEE